MKRLFLCIPLVVVSLILGSCTQTLGEKDTRFNPTEVPSSDYRDSTLISGNDKDSLENKQNDSRTISNLINNAFLPVGKCLYVYGGGWNEADDAAGVEAMQIGIPEKWISFYNSNNSSYDYNQTRYQIHNGLDCTGYIGWCMYQVFQNEYSDNGYVYLASEMTAKYSDVFKGIYTPKYDVTVHKCGDIMSSSGHAYIVVGTCSDGSVVFLHASPPNVSLCGTYTPSGNSNSEAIRLAEHYMQSYFNECYSKYPRCSRNSAYLTDYNKMSWNSDILPDPDGYREMSANDILYDFFEKYKIYLNGNRIAKEYDLYNMNSTIFVPLRVISESLGATVEWDAGKIRITKGTQDISLMVNSKNATINGTSYELLHDVFLVNDRSYVPLRFISEAFSLDVNWDGNRKAVLLNN